MDGEIATEGTIENVKHYVPGKKAEHFWVGGLDVFPDSVLIRALHERTGDGVISDFYMKELISVLMDIAKYLKKIAENSGDDGK